MHLSRGMEWNGKECISVPYQGLSWVYDSKLSKSYILVYLILTQGNYGNFYGPEHFFFFVPYYR